MSRAGFSLAELLVALVIAGIIGLALTKLVISQARFVATQDGTMRARAVARAGLSVLADELRQISSGAVVQANSDSITVRIPYAFGVVCGQTGGTTVAVLMPPDSARYASATMAGYSWRDANGVWSTVEPATRASSGTALCASASPSITTTSLTSVSGVTYGVALSPNVVATPVGGIVYMYQRVRYAFAPSVELPGREGLWREVIGSGVREELVTPFDTTAKFQFLVGGLLRKQNNVPSSLDSILGVRVLLTAQSERPAPGKTQPSKFPLISDIVFRNHDP